jgi:hypothetical protein
MKKTLLLLSILFIALGAKAQGNLQFNQVITGGASLAPLATSSTLTVPINKVWKIEAINGSYTNGLLKINTIEVTTTVCNFPFWLKAGDTFSFRNSGCSTCGTQNFHYSIIEFNIIP